METAAHRGVIWAHGSVYRRRVSFSVYRRRVSFPAERGRAAHRGVVWARGSVYRRRVSFPVSIGVGFRFQRREGERRHPAGRERMGSPTLQTLEEPILRMPLGLLSS
jgi:hypothetical protein